MSTILNSTEDHTNLNQNTFSTRTSNHLMVNENQHIDSNLTKKFLTGHRGNIWNRIVRFEVKTNEKLDCQCCMLGENRDMHYALTIRNSCVCVTICSL